MGNNFCYPTLKLFIRSNVFLFLVLSNLLNSNNSHASQFTLDQLLENCERLAGDPWDPRSKDRNIRISNIFYEKAVGICRQAVSRKSELTNSSKDDVEHWMARSLLAASFQTDGGFDPKGLDILKMLMLKNYCPSAAALQRIVTYTINLHFADRERILGSYDFENLVNTINKNSDIYLLCPNYRVLVDISRFDQSISSGPGDKQERFTRSVSILRQAIEDENPDAQYRLVLAAYASLDKINRDSIERHSAFAELLGQAATQTHVSSMLLYYTILEKSKVQKIRRNAIRWLEKAISLRSPRALLECVISKPNKFSRDRKFCRESLNNKILLAKVDEITSAFIELSKTPKDRQKRIAAYQKSAILTSGTLELEW